MTVFRIGAIQDTKDDNSAFAGSGFVVYGESNKPIVSFGFGSRRDAENAAEHMRVILETAKAVTPTG